MGGLYLQGGIGDLAAMDFATISVEYEDVEMAASIISEYDKNTHSKKSEHKNKSLLTAPLIVLVLSVILMLLLAIYFSDYR